MNTKSGDMLTQTEEQLAKLQEEYETLVTGTEQKLDELRGDVSLLESEKKALTATLDEQKSYVLPTTFFMHLYKGVYYRLVQSFVIRP